MNTIFIEKTPNADSRTADGDLRKDLILLDTTKHITAVRNTMFAIGDEMRKIGNNHDRTKISHFDQFFEDFSKHRLDLEHVDFKALPWWQIHITERHHLNDKCPEDVDLFDVFEMIADCVCAGKARSGEVYPVKLSNDILQRAVENTQKLLERNIKIVPK